MGLLSGLDKVIVICLKFILFLRTQEQDMRDIVINGDVVSGFYCMKLPLIQQRIQTYRIKQF